MGTYMIVVLKSAYKTESSLQRINEEIHKKFAAPFTGVFVTNKFLQEEADFFNNDPEGLTQIPHFERPITTQILSDSFFWYRVGEFHCKLSGGINLEEAFICIAVCKWLIATECKFINKMKSSYYEKETLENYTNYILEENNIDPKQAWALPA